MIKRLHLKVTGQEMAISGMMDADGKNPIQITRNKAKELGASWSPDGKSIVFESRRNGNGDIVCQEGGMKLLENIAPRSRYCSYPWNLLLFFAWGNPSYFRYMEDSYGSFSPDGKNIVYVSNRSGSQDIWIMDRNGKNAMQLMNWTSEETYPSWSPDGRLSPLHRIKMEIWIYGS